MLVWSSSLCNFLYNLTGCYYDPITKGKNIWFLLRLCLNICSSVTSDSHGGREHAVPPLNQTQQIWQIESSGVWRSRSKTSNVFSRGTWMQKCWQEHLDPFFVKLVDWMSSLCHSSVPAVAVHRISCTVAANICVLVCLHPYNQHLSVPFTIFLPQFHTWMSLPSVRHILPYCPEFVQWRHMLAETALNRNIATILPFFQSFFIILLVPPIQERPDKSAAQWTAWWRGSSGVWMALACVMFERAAVLFSAV